MTDVILPTTAAELAEALSSAAADGRAVVPWGAGTLQHLGWPAEPEALALRTTALSRIVEYNPADLTITVEAGVALGAVQAALRPHGQWLPWDPPAPGEATIGGLLAVGASGPLRLGYGTPRDWVLGMRVALADGRLVKSGGKVVKNVAGYDAHKLHIGALGTLGVIVEVTLKVAPLPESIETRVFACGSRGAALALAEQMRARPLAPVSLIVLPAGQSGQGAWLAARFAGVPAAVERQVRAAEAAAAVVDARVVAMNGAAAGELWRERANAGLSAPPSASGKGHARADVIIRAGAQPAALGSLLDALERSAPLGRSAAVGFAGVGLAYDRWSAADGTVPALGAALAELRGGIAILGGYAVVEYAPAELRPRLDPWGPPPPTLPLMRALKAQWDPRGVLNRGRYIV
jgi:glycolate oxidase FAD binding subunit